MALFRFLQYNNAVPVALSILLLGAGGVFAATNPETIISSEQQILSVDNTYIANKNLSSFTPSVQITGVTEDDEFYYVAYNFFTIDLQDYVWQDVTKNETLKVSKEALGPYRDLGLYVTEQLKQLVAREITRLKETQEIERNSVSHKVVATAYSGLVGAMLDDKTEELPGYSPVIEETGPTPPQTEQQPEEQQGQEDLTASSTEEVSDSGDSSPEEADEETSEEDSSSGGSSGSSSDTTPPTVQVLGENPVRIELEAEYSDLGAAATDNTNEDLNVALFVNDEAVEEISLDTSQVGEWVIRYEATDSAGNTGSAERTIEVYDPAAEQTSSGSASTTPETTPPSGGEDTIEEEPPPPAEEIPAEEAPSETPPAEDPSTSQEEIPTEPPPSE